MKTYSRNKCELTTLPFALRNKLAPYINTYDSVCYSIVTASFHKCCKKQQQSGKSAKLAKKKKPKKLPSQHRRAIWALHLHTSMFVSVIVSLSTGNQNRNLTSSHQDHYDLNTAVNPWDIFSRSSLNRVLSFPNVSIKCLDFTIATKRGLTRNDDCYKNTQRDVPGGLNDIGEGGTDMFSK